MKRNQTQSIIIMCCICAVLFGCNVSGQIGSTFNFPTSKQNMELAIDSLYAKYPEYKVPAKWQAFNNFSPGASAYIEGKVFYFKSNPEEMYYVSLISGSGHHSGRVGLAIRAINKGSADWLQEQAMGYDDEDRIQARFKTEIISKLETFTGVKAKKRE
jgi:hypothetical protein